VTVSVLPLTQDALHLLLFRWMDTFSFWSIHLSFTASTGSVIEMRPIETMNAAVVLGLSAAGAVQGRAASAPGRVFFGVATEEIRRAPCVDDTQPPGGRPLTLLRCMGPRRRGVG
jgi:hypothetical protein